MLEEQEENDDDSLDEMAERMERSGSSKSTLKKRPRIHIGYDSDEQEEE